MRRMLGVVLAALVLAACAPNDEDGGGVRVVASFYALAEAAERVGEDLVDVTNLTPAGVEPHDVELTANDLDAIAGADVALFVGGGFQPAIDDAAAESDGRVDVGRAVGLVGGDPHFWLDPALMEKAVIVVRDALSDADPENAPRFEENANAYIGEIRRLDQRMTTTLADCPRRDVVTSHEAFGYLTRRYKLTEHSIAGISPESEPGADRLAELTDLVRARGITTVFYEELVPRDLADTLAMEAGVATAVLNPLEGLTEQEIEAGEDYVSVMGRNRVALATALGCASP